MMLVSYLVAGRNGLPILAIQKDPCLVYNTNMALFGSWTVRFYGKHKCNNKDKISVGVYVVWEIIYGPMESSAIHLMKKAKLKLCNMNVINERNMNISDAINEQKTTAFTTAVLDFSSV